MVEALALDARIISSSATATAGAQLQLRWQ
jgi:hypothetical protein